MSPSPPRVSVCIRSVDRPDALREAVASVLAQTVEDWELIVSFDGAPPEPGGLPDDPRIRCTSNPGPPDATASLAHALRLASGDFLAILDDDDRWMPGFLAATLLPFEAEDRKPGDEPARLGVVFADYALVTGERTLPRRWPWASGEQAEMLLPLLDRSIPPSAALVRRDAYLDGETLLPLAPGLAGAATIWLRAAVQGWRFHHVPGLLVEYRLHSGQMSWAAETTAARYAATLDRLDFTGDPIAEQARQARLTEAHYTQAGLHLRRRRIFEARAAFGRARLHGRLRTARNLIAVSGVRRLAARWLPSHPRVMDLGMRVWSRVRPRVG